MDEDIETTKKRVENKMVEYGSMGADLSPPIDPEVAELLKDYLQLLEEL